AAPVVRIVSVERSTAIDQLQRIAAMVSLLQEKIASRNAAHILMPIPSAIGVSEGDNRVTLIDTYVISNAPSQFSRVGFEMEKGDEDLFSNFSLYADDLPIFEGKNFDSKSGTVQFENMGVIVQPFTQVHIRLYADATADKKGAAVMKLKNFTLMAIDGTDLPVSVSGGEGNEIYFGE